MNLYIINFKNSFSKIKVYFLKTYDFIAIVTINKTTIPIVTTIPATAGAQLKDDENISASTLIDAITIKIIKSFFDQNLSSFLSFFSKLVSQSKIFFFSDFDKIII